MYISENIEDYKDCKYYLTHFNGSRPFCVYINENEKENEVTVFKKSNENSKTYTTFVASFKAKEIFIGESPLNEKTNYSGGYGPYFDGNSILLKMDTYDYVFIGKSIFSFKTEYEIIKFVSYVGSNLVPYPYAIDTDNNCYFLLGKNSGILKLTDITDDPYDNYFSLLNNLSKSENIECVYICNKRYFIETNTTPAEAYDDIVKNIGSPMYIKFNGESKRVIDKTEYINLLDNYNKKVGLSPLLDYKVISEITE